MVLLCIKNFKPTVYHRCKDSVRKSKYLFEWLRQRIKFCFQLAVLYVFPAMQCKCQKIGQTYYLKALAPESTVKILIFFYNHTIIVVWLLPRSISLCANRYKHSSTKVLKVKQCFCSK